MVLLGGAGFRYVDTASRSARGFAAADMHQRNPGGAGWYEKCPSRSKAALCLHWLQRAVDEHNRVLGRGGKEHHLRRALGAASADR